MTEPLRIAWLTTARGEGSYGGLEYALGAIDDGLPVELAVVFVNRDRGEAEPTDRLIAMAEGRGVPVEALSSVRFRKERGGERSKPGEPLPAWRPEFDAEIARRLERYGFELGVMFGYMLIATPELHQRHPFINDHPALPDGPVGTWQQVIVELIRSRAVDSGCLMHLVTEDLDRGPVVSFCRYRIADACDQRSWDHAAALEDPSATPLFAEIRRRGVARERPFLVETLRAISGGGLALPPETPLNLTAAVERSVQG
jgi:folate-dependent phosphoribosylglycinamide formyltransferase PurN